MRGNYDPTLRDLDFDKITWKCHICSASKSDKFIKMCQHDISRELNADMGTFVMNVRYCIDNPSCKENAFNREWIRKNRLSHLLLKDEITICEVSGVTLNKEGQI